MLLENYERPTTLHGGGGYAELVGTILKGMGGAFTKAPADPGSLDWFFDEVIEMFNIGKAQN